MFDSIFLVFAYYEDDSSHRSCSLHIFAETTPDGMRILALNPFHAGSHRAFLDGWTARSRHQFTTLTLPGRRWKWRMRHAAVEFAREAGERGKNSKPWDVLFTTDMLNLAEFRGLTDPDVARLPAVVYFHENQLTYPDREERERDLHFVFTNFTTALAADRVWFNSQYHQNEFLGALDVFLSRMPDAPPKGAVDSIREKCEVQSPGVASFRRFPSDESAGPLQILWVSRWEHDKDPDTFFTALELLAFAGADFRLNVLGESYRQAPACFEAARTRFADRIDHWGFQESAKSYHRILSESDVVVSTARHEFFGVAVVEAAAAGCFPIVPRRLAYPEVLGDRPEYFHDGTPEGLATRLAAMLARRKAQSNKAAGAEDCRPPDVSRFAWDVRAAEMDDAIDALRPAMQNNV